MAITNIAINPQFGNNTVTQINCGHSSPRIGGQVDVSAYPNLNTLICTFNDITSCTGYTNNSNMQSIQLFDNKLTGSLPSLNSLVNLQSFNISLNSLTGSIPSLNNNTQLKYFFVNNQQGSTKITGSIPSLSNNSQLLYFWCNDNQISGSIPSLTNNTQLISFHCASNQNITGSIPSLAANGLLEEFRCHNNQISGSIPSLSNLTKLKVFHTGNNLHSGTIPSLANNTNLEEFYVQFNRVTGAIPNLTNNIKLKKFHCNNQTVVPKLNDFGGGSVSNTLGEFFAQDNQLPSVAVNAILAAFVAAGRTSANAESITPGFSTCTLNLGGTGNSAPTGQGIIDKGILESRGWTVTTNP